MIRRLVVRTISVLLIANGLAGVLAVVVGWSVAADLLATLRQTGSTIAAQQARLSQSVNGVAVAVDDAAQATDGLSQSSLRAQASAAEATQTADNLAATFDYLAEVSRLSVLGAQPLTGMAQSFATNAQDFRALSATLTTMSGSLGDNSRDMARVGADLRSINQQLQVAAGDIRALPSATLLQDGIASLELSVRLFLGLILFESVLSASIGLAFLLLLGPAPPATQVDLARHPRAIAAGGSGEFDDLTPDPAPRRSGETPPLSASERGRGQGR